ncbi:MAG: hypothetical protein GY777_20920 [Candidatus Brocadiaceae bacterium]|nr:hypothetical protein [Candidatus Brocadiaceae bacterium]
MLELSLPELIGFIIASGGLILGARRFELIKLKEETRKAEKERDKAETDSKELESRLKDIEERLHHLDDKETGRVHKVSELCIEQIKSNKEASANAKAALIIAKNFIKVNDD